ncbi:Aerotaxis receptor [Vibrio ruber DSM 16370]|uniref:Aerotaxis receptor n=1 Tax=Vibrio ruber (strain DSM 16370 / JCM 11486 / BCRC 17186 / CECT 7878 / LMG 23124 / VR1) TaxID=1123498 RepID=A0A1R4LGM0_VIBR1|nr:PAS domain-containing protein [Vibrio ruber]SJN55593.1 Aerotaxis receptor [Vibrio ruber DSM 16370]
MAATEQEVSFDRNELIITKTDLQGKITYANRTFMRVANYVEADLLGRDHNLIRHPSMPRGVFYGLWHALKSGTEFFGFVKNYTSDKNYYWVFANITPDRIGTDVVGFYSVRRVAPKDAVQTIEGIYQKMRELEQATERKQAPEVSWRWLVDLIHQQYHMEYEEYIIDLYQQHRSD